MASTTDPGTEVSAGEAGSKLQVEPAEGSTEKKKHVLKIELVMIGGVFYNICMCEACVARRLEPASV